jgi:hypothetical protein
VAKDFIPARPSIRIGSCCMNARSKYRSMAVDTKDIDHRLAGGNAQSVRSHHCAGLRLSQRCVPGATSLRQRRLAFVPRSHAPSPAQAMARPKLAATARLAAEPPVGAVERPPMLDARRRLCGEAAAWPSLRDGVREVYYSARMRGSGRDTRPDTRRNGRN